MSSPSASEREKGDEDEKEAANEVDELTDDIERRQTTADAASDHDEDTDDDREFPAQFYDPSTGNLLKEPVVNAVGDSVEGTDNDEAEAHDDVSDTTKNYPNRALEAIIEREVAMSAEGAMGSVRRMQDSLRNGWSSLLGKSAFSHEHRPLPDAFYCSIACELMLDPVIEPISGQSYEREAIAQWVAANGTSPTTRQALALTDLRPNNNLYELIQLEKGATDESLHPSIRRWKESGVASQRPDPADSMAAAAEAATTEGDQQYPTTLEELEQRRQQLRRQSEISSRALLIALIVLFLFIPYNVGFALLFSLLILMGLCLQKNNNDNQQTARR